MKKCCRGVGGWGIALKGVIGPLVNVNMDCVLDTSIVVGVEMHHSQPEDSVPGVVKLLASSELASGFKRGSRYSLHSSHPITEKGMPGNFCPTWKSSKRQS